MAKLVTLATYYDISAALADYAFLDASGINVFLFNRYYGHVFWQNLPAVGGIRIVVPEPEHKDAGALLASGDEFTGDGTVDVCPQCESGAIMRGRSMGVILLCGMLWSVLPILVIVLLFRLLLGLPVVVFARQRLCRRCGHRWRAA